jgi:phosphohistidine phosphatase
MQLLLFRHSKAEPHDGPRPDRERELTERGRGDAAAMGRILAERELVPDLVLSSDSVRTRQTTAALMEQWSAQPETTFLPELYSARAEDLIEAASLHGATARRIMLVGHNPTMEELASQVAGREVRLKTSAAAVLELQAARWSDLTRPADLAFVEVITPPGKK